MTAITAYLMSLNNTLETIIISGALFISFIFCVIIAYKLIKADKIKAGIIEIIDEPEIKEDEK